MLKLSGSRPQTVRGASRLSSVGGGRGRDGSLARALRRSPDYGLVRSAFSTTLRSSAPSGCRCSAPSRPTPAGRAVRGSADAGGRDPVSLARRVAEIIESRDGHRGLQVRYPALVPGSAGARGAALGPAPLACGELLGRRRCTSAASGRRVIPAGGCWSPGPAVRSAASSAARSTASARGAVPARPRRVQPARDSSSSSPEAACWTPTRSSSPTSATQRRSPGLRRRPARRWSSTPQRTSTCRCSNASRAKRVKSNVAGHPATWSRPRSSTAPAVHPHLYRQGGRPDLGARRHETAGRTGRPGAPPAVAGTWPPSGSATCWAAGARSCPCSRTRSPRAEPVTVTHPDVTRYFMTVEEAVGLVLEAAAMAEYGETFVLDMGEPVRIVDLVQNYLMQVHAPPVHIRFTGLRPGEKLNETLFSESEQRLPTAHPRIYATRPPPFQTTLRVADTARRGGNAQRGSGGSSPLASRHERAEAGGREEMAPTGSAPYPDGF